MSGEEEYLERMEREIENNLIRQGVFHISCPEVYYFMSLSGEELESQFNSNEIGQMSYDLSRFSFYLQQRINFFHTRIKICQINIERLVGGELKKYEYVGGKERWIMAINDNLEAKRWKNIQEDAEINLSPLQYLPSQLEEISKRIKDASQRLRK